MVENLLFASCDHLSRNDDKNWKIVSFSKGFSLLMNSWEIKRFR